MDGPVAGDIDDVAPAEANASLAERAGSLTLHRATTSAISRVCGHVGECRRIVMGRWADDE